MASQQKSWASGDRAKGSLMCLLTRLDCQSQRGHRCEALDRRPKSSAMDELRCSPWPLLRQMEQYMPNTRHNIFVLGVQHKHINLPSATVMRL